MAAQLKASATRAGYGRAATRHSRSALFVRPAPRPGSRFQTAWTVLYGAGTVAFVGGLPSRHFTSWLPGRKSPRPPFSVSRSRPAPAERTAEPARTASVTTKKGGKLILRGETRHALSQVQGEFHALAGGKRPFVPGTT